jgi:hypothetical protein
MKRLRHVLFYIAGGLLLAAALAASGIHIASVQKPPESRSALERNSPVTSGRIDAFHHPEASNRLRGKKSCQFAG